MAALTGRSAPSGTGASEPEETQNPVPADSAREGEPAAVASGSTSDMTI